MTIPQHANIRLLDNHKQYETYIKRTYRYIEEFHAETGSRILKTIEDYIRISKCGLPLAIRTTAGAMIMFYNQINEKEPNS